MTEPLLVIDDLSVHYAHGGALRRMLPGARAGVTRAVDRVSLRLEAGEIVGLVGESGSGKSTLGRVAAGLHRPVRGTVTFDGRPVTGRGRGLTAEVQMIFQDPHASLSPRRRVGYLLTEPYVVNRVPVGERRPVDELLALVGLPAELADKRPHELSGGQARRVGIARALVMQPRFVVADEPTSGLDVSAAAGVLELLRRLCRELGITFLVITHDLNSVGQLADRIAVMHHGELVEVGPADDVLDRPQHDYTRALLSAAPDIDDVLASGPAGAAARPDPAVPVEPK